MNKRKISLIVSIALAMMAVVLGSVSPLYAHTLADEQPIYGGELKSNPLESSMVVVAELEFNVAVESVLAPGVLGLPGELVEWVASIENTGSATAYDVVITTTLHEGLRIDAVETVRGEVTIDGTVATITVNQLAAGEMLTYSIQTTVLRSPANGRLFNQTVLSATGPAGAMTHSTSAEMYVPTGLPATGYAADEELPGEGEPSVVAVGLMAFSTVMAAALFVWYRGRRVWF